MQNITAPAVLLSALLLTPMAFLVTPSASGQAVDGPGSVVDFNGDGYSDLAMGQPFYDISPVFFEFHLLGAVTALYGSASVLGDEQVWHQDVANVEDAAEDDEMFGAAVSAG